MSETDEKTCRARLAELEEENIHLRRAAARFGELAERLSEELAKERRLRADRRKTDRQSGDRHALTNADNR